jgi:26S proteasome regulatory subunit N8
MVKAFSVKTNDQMHMTYVCSIIRAIVALHNLINNKIYNMDKSLEDEKKEKEKKEEATKKKDESVTVPAKDDKQAEK